MREQLEKLLRSVDAPHPERAELLWAEYRAGGPGADAAFATLLAWHGGAVYRRIWGFVRSDAADDVFQDVLTRLHRGRARFATFEHALRWWRGVAVTQSLNAHRAAARRRARELARGVPPEGVTPPVPRFELQEALRVALASLTKQEQQAVALVYFEGLTKQDAARELGVHRDTLAKVLDGALAKLRTALPAAAIAGTATTTVTLEAALSSLPLVLPARLVNLAAQAWDHARAAAHPAGVWLPGKAQLLAGVVLGGLVAVSLALTARSSHMTTAPPNRARLGVERLEARDVPSFGTNGRVVIDFNPSGQDLVLGMSVQSDGRIVTAGGDRVARYTAGGALDPTFNAAGTPGSVQVPSHLRAVAVLTDGRIIAAGGVGVGAQTDFRLHRFLSDGTPDPTFGVNGVVTTGFKKGSGAYDMARAVAVQSDGKIVVAGDINRGSTGGGWGVARYNADGSLDKTFDGDGWLTTTFRKGNTSDIAYAVAVQPDGKIVVGGTVTTGTERGYEFAAARYLPSGALDTSFGSGGKVLLDFAAELGGSYTNDQAYDMALQGDGKVVLVGAAGGHSAVARLNPNGTPDTTFSGNGRAVWQNPVSGHAERLYAVAVQPDGRIVAVGGDGSAQVHRFTTDGEIDPTFNGSGWNRFRYRPDTGAQGYEVAVQPDGKILVAGSAGSESIAALARFNPGGWFDGSPAPQIGSFTASSYTPPAGGTLTLTASDVAGSNPGATVTRVEFYYFDGNGKQPLGDGTETSPGVWTLTVTVALPPGYYTLYSQATDSDGAVGDPRLLSLQVV